MKSHNVTRISLNPQTLNDETLACIGRHHTTAEFFEAYALANQEGIQNINTDIILGLPGETADHVRHTLDGLAQLKPTNLTVHTLTVKRASRLKENLSAYPSPDTDIVEEMHRQSRRGAREMGMIPYYLYRQKNTLGNFENVGYCQPGWESFYNVLIMEETQDIWGAGAGAVSKLVERSVNRVERVFNVKSLDDYIVRIDEMIARKQAALR
jgi:oxygen-independent coproporphyrinogen-3 oxidase